MMSVTVTVLDNANENTKSGHNDLALTIDEAQRSSSAAVFPLIVSYFKGEKYFDFKDRNALVGAGV